MYLIWKVGVVNENTCGKSVGLEMIWIYISVDSENICGELDRFTRKNRMNTENVHVNSMNSQEGNKTTSDSKDCMTFGSY